MININQTSEQTKILIPRSNINGDIEKNNYVTEDELQEILKEHNSIPYLIIDYLSILDGDWQKVYDAISNNQPYLIYHKRHSDGYLITVDSAAIRDNYIDVLFCRETYNDNTVQLYYTIVDIYPDRLEVQRDEIIDIPTQFKTVNGNEITGTGDIIIESGGNIVELTQEEYNNTTPEPDTLYVINDAPAVEIPDTSEFVTITELDEREYTSVNSFKTINNQSIVGSGNITIEGGSGSEPLYLWKALGNIGDGPHMQENLQVRNLLLSLKSSEEYPIVILKDYYNDTICNNIYVSTDYVEIQCCNSRISGTSNELTDERYELASDGSLQIVKNDVVATQNYVDEQIGDINSVLENIIG